MHLSRPVTLAALAAVFILLPIYSALANPGQEALDASFTPPAPTTKTRTQVYQDSCTLITRWKGQVSSSGSSLATDFDSCTPYTDAHSYCTDPLAAARPDLEVMVAIESQLKATTPATPKLACIDEPTLRQQGAGELPSSISATGALSFGAAFQEQFIDALSAFLVKRAKAEALSWAGGRMYKELCGIETGNPLFPGLCTIIDGIGNSSAPPISWGAARQAAIQDFRELPVHLLPYLPTLLDEAGFPDDVIADVSILLGSTTHVTEAMLAGDNVLETLAALEAYAESIPSASAGRLQPWVELIGIVAAETRAKIYAGLQPGESRWRPSDTYLRHLVRELGARLPTLPNNGKPELVTYLGSDAGRVQLAVLIANLTEVAAAGKRATANPDAPDSLIRLLKATGKSFGQIATIIRNYHGIDTSAACDPKSDDAKVKLVCSVHALEQADAALEMVGSIHRHEYAAAFAQVMIWLDATKATEALPSWFRAWLPFLAELASAKDAKAMEGALESLAAPVGSYSIKRNSDQKFHAMLNAYVGVQGGGEVLLTDGRWGGHVGPTASIGFEISWGLPNKSSVGLYTPILDVGGLADFRIGGSDANTDTSNDEVDTTPTIGFAQVFAPGLFVVFGLGNSPIALALGAQISPALRSTSDTTDNKTFTSLQVGGFLAIDIPVWIIH